MISALGFIGMRQRLAQVAERMKAGGRGWRLKPEFAVRELFRQEVKNSLFLEWINGRLPAIPTGVLVVIYAFEQSTKSIWRKA